MKARGKAEYVIAAANLAEKRYPKKPRTEAFICRLANGRYGLVIWGGEHNGYVSDFAVFSAAHLKARICGALLIHCDI